MNMLNLSDESLLAFYESVRRQVIADTRPGGRHRLAGPTMRQYAERLGNELSRRRVPFNPIDWPSADG